MSRVEHLAEGVTLYCGDCREILPGLGPVDAVVTDPPYGLGEKMQGGTWGAKTGSKSMLDWDRAPPPPDLLAHLIGRARESLLWGGQYFHLPPARCWLIWNKINAVPTMADCEVAWTNLDRPTKRWDGPVGRVEFGHPTQKPLGLMLWSLGFLRSDATTILDPFMGSGTTGVAAVRLGRRFVGIEIDEGYFDVACRRIADEIARPRLALDAPAPAPVQEPML